MMKQVEDKSVTISWVTLANYADQIKGLSGLEHMKMVKEGRLPEPPILKLIGFRHGDVEPGRIVFEFDPREQHFNGIGIVHGGVAATLLDSAMGTAIYTKLNVGQATSTIQLNINFLKPMTDASGTMRCEGKVISVGRTVATAEGRLVDQSGRIYAHGTTTCLIVPV